MKQDVYMAVPELAPRRTLGGVIAVWVLAVLAFYLLWGRRHSLLARQPEGADAAAAGAAEGPAGGGS